MKKLLKKMNAAFLVMVLATIPTITPQAAIIPANTDTSVLSRAAVQNKVRNQIIQLRAEGLKNVVNYEMEYGDTLRIKEVKTTLELDFNANKLSQDELALYSSMTDAEIRVHLKQIYEETAKDFQNSNNIQKTQLKELKAGLQELAPVSRQAVNSSSTPVTKSRSHDFTAPIIDAMGYAQMTVYYDATCQNNRFTGGEVTGCELRQGIAIGVWEYKYGSVYPVIETDNGRYLAYQVRGKWTIMKNGVTIAGEKVYDFTDNRPF